jgi:regulator of sigma E protease
VSGREIEVQADPLTAILAFVVLIGLIVVVHELGHYSVARMFGTAIKSFSVGFGPVLASAKDRRGTTWKISALPLGGFVSFIEDRSDAEAQAIPGKTYSELTAPQRIAVASAGPLANFIFASLVFAGFSLFMGERTERLVIADVRAGSAAEAAGFLAGDTITRIDGRRFEAARDVTAYVQMRSDTPIRFEVDRAGEVVEITAIPLRTVIRNGLGIEGRVGQLGIAFEGGLYEVERLGPISSLGAGVAETWVTIERMAYSLWRVVTLREPVDQLSGPLGIGDLAGRVVKVNADGAAAAQHSWWQTAGAVALGLLSLSAFLSVAVGFFNLLPLPVLDGGHIVFYTWEVLTGKPVSAGVQQVAMTASMALLLGLAVVVTWFDIQRITAP